MNAPEVPPSAPSATSANPAPATTSAQDVRSITLELAISELLRWGVFAATGVILVGMALTFFHHPDYFVSVDSLSRLTSPVHGPHSLEEVLAGVYGIRGASIEMAGLLLLIALPVARVAFSLAVFVVRKDRKFVWLSGLVLLFLTVSFLLGRAE